MGHARMLKISIKRCTEEKMNLCREYCTFLHIRGTEEIHCPVFRMISLLGCISVLFCWNCTLSLFIYISLVNHQNIFSTKSLKQMMFQFNPVLVLWVDQNLFCVIFYLVFSHWNQFLLDRCCLNSRYQIDIWIHVICCWCNYGVFRKICRFSQRTRSMMFFFLFHFLLRLCCLI